MAKPGTGMAKPAVAGRKRQPRYAWEVAGPHRLPIAALALAAILLATSSAQALVVAGDSTNEQAPPNDPGWTHVGRLGTVTGIYLGGGWVLTASHAGLRDLVIGDATYPAVPDSRIKLDMPGQPQIQSDVALFRVDPAPDLPPLELQREAPETGTPALLVGLGQSRGAPYAGTAGWNWKQGRVRRWGTNEISRVGFDLAGPGKRLTRCFRMNFDRDGTPHEAQAAKGDSGGAVFLWDGQAYQLGGIMISIGYARGQAPDTALFGNFTNAVDISQYVPQIEAAMQGKTQPTPETRPAPKAPSGAPAP